MLSFLRWFIGCWHQWEAWQAYRVNGYAGQKRRCAKCGKETLRYVSAPA